MAVEDLTDDMVYAALYQGLSPDEPLMKKLTRKQPDTLQGLIDRVDEFINQEETLTAMISARRPQEPTPKKKKEPKKIGMPEPKPVKKFADFNFTPINARATEVLAIMKEDPEFCQPPKITGTPPPHNRDKYCKYHAATSHTTEGCITLRMLI